MDFFAAVLKDIRTLEADSDQHFKFMRMSKEMSDHSLQLLSPSLQKNKKISPPHPRSQIGNDDSNILSPTQLPPPSQVQWQTISQENFERWNMPNCLGAIDGKHINIQAPTNSGKTDQNQIQTIAIVHTEKKVEEQNKEMEENKNSETHTEEHSQIKELDIICYLEKDELDNIVSFFKEDRKKNQREKERAAWILKRKEDNIRKKEVQRR
ncbi:hypothetical protein JTB14_015360 [Gonioctena quinquepunctata]|nr:hypothetical protein JTB14_015360 [Gonioctena quinquepunctata]